jgi:hypothetical protein
MAEKKAVNKRLLGIALIALGVIRSLFIFRADGGESGADYITLLLLGAGAIIYFSSKRRRPKTSKRP